jgi:toxin FitB
VSHAGHDARLFLLDTNVVSELRAKRPDPEVLRWVDANRGRVAISVVAVQEIQAGAELARPGAPEAAARIEAWLDGIVAAGLPLPGGTPEPAQILSPGPRAARLVGRMQEHPALRNFARTQPNQRRPANAGDLWVAAIAAEQGAPVATRDVDDFRRIHGVVPLPGVYDPWAGRWAVAPMAASPEPISEAGEDQAGASPPP